MTDAQSADAQSADPQTADAQPADAQPADDRTAGARPTGRPVVDLPVQRACPFLPPAEYAGLRESGPVVRATVRGRQTIWVITRHEESRAMLTDPRFSSNAAHPGFPALLPIQRDFATNIRPPMNILDAPEHTRARRAVLGEFTVRRMNALKPRIQQLVDEHIDAMLAGPRPCDLVKGLALPVPSLVICEQLGVPYEDHEFFQGCSTKTVQSLLPDEVRAQAMAELSAYIDALIRKKEEEPTDDLLGRQILKQRESGEVNREELVSLAMLLLVAGHETTANQIALGTLALLEHPEIRAQVESGPEAVPGAVEELLRYFTIVDFATSRVATEDVELGGVTIRAGEGVTALQNSVNHDPDVFARPDELDIARGDHARRHMAFGYGAHQCIGQNLARLELEIAYETLFRRIPGLRLAVPFDELRFKDDDVTYGPHALPVTW